MLTIPNLSALLAVVLLCATVHAGADCSGCSAPRRSLLGRVWGEVVDAVRDRIDGGSSPQSPQPPQQPAAGTSNTRGRSFRGAWQQPRQDQAASQQPQQQPSGGAAQQPDQGASSQGTAPDYSNLSAYAQRALDAHNQLRSAHSTAPLRWNASLEASAAAWAGNCRFEHQQGTGEGENLAWGYSDIGAAVSDWYAEGAAANGGSGYTYGASQPADWHAVGHFTQLLWAATSDLGCAAASCTGTDGQPAVMHVCRYYVPGNVEGEYANNVLPPASVQQTR
ncbi:hypothetical protein CHLRE_02g083100v5 [Chlamydomonas reinhardtii]|uniref:SCP domain-containing protein n=1 Tax=Chlamydomonas reinhardtii TaxID=3055 RepID=A0A2K3E0P5_CHLRE|nr:uncharacterized protein CHLRE_02g083100v5 [Chlamydomonas reinhardtii]PNW86351.1 hypothetical protein CHLRE_02g083100v5 [Chlamydomonas reinhardtii]